MEHKYLKYKSKYLGIKNNLPKHHGGEMKIIYYIVKNIT